MIPKDLCPKECQDVMDLYLRGSPYIKKCRETCLGNVMPCAPVIELKSMRELAMSDELGILFQLYWILFFHTVFDYLQMWGVAPWYPETVGNTIHRIPVCPPFGAGRIQTWLGENRKQRYRYVWLDGEVDSRMFFETKNNPPLFDGRLTSPMVTMLKDHKLILEVREALDIAVYRQAHTQHIFEFHPPKNVVGDDNLMVLEGLGDNIAATVMSQTEGMHKQKFFLRSDTTQQALAMAREANDRTKSKFGTGKMLRSESDQEAWERQNGSVLDNGVTLPPDMTYKSVAAPNVQADLLRLVDHFNRNVSILLDVPTSMFEAGGGGGSGYSKGSGGKTITANVQV